MAKVVAVVSVTFFLTSYFLPCFAMMTGGISTINQPLKSTVIMKGLDIFLMNESRALQANYINHHENLLYKRICDTLQASEQVVEGTLYRVALKIVPVNKQLEQKDCINEDDSLPEKFVCFTVWHRPWLEQDEDARLIVEKEAAGDYKSCLQVNSQKMVMDRWKFRR